MEITSPKTLNHYAVLLNYFSNTELIKIIGGEGLIRYVKPSLFRKIASIEQQEEIIANIERLYSYIGDTLPNSEERFFKVMAIAQYFDVRLFTFKYNSNQLLKDVYNSQPLTRKSMTSGLGRFRIASLLSMAQTHPELGIIDDMPNMVKQLRLPDKSQSDRAQYVDVETVKRSITKAQVHDFMSMYRRNQTFIERMNYTCERLPSRWSFVRKTRINTLLHSAFSLTLTEKDFDALSEDEFADFVAKFVEVLKLQIAQCYVVDQTNLAHENTTDLVLLSDEYNHDEINASLNDLNILLRVISASETKIDKLFITPELQTLLQPLVKLDVLKAMDADKRVQTFRPRTKIHMHALRSILERNKRTNKNRRIALFIDVKNLFTLYDDFRLYGRYEARYSNEFIAKQSHAWRKAMGNLTPSFDELAITKALKIETPQS